MEDEQYLGDGIYAKFDGYYIWIWTSNGIRQSERIAFEPDSFNSLLGMAQRCWRQPKVER